MTYHMTYRRFMKCTSRMLAEGKAPEDMVAPIIALRNALLAVPFGFRRRVFRWIWEFLDRMGTEVVENAVDQD